MKLRATPIGWREAAAFVDREHRHHRRPQGWKWGIGAELDGQLVAVVMVGRPVSRNLDDGLTAEVIRLASDGTRNACSFLYGAARRAAFEMGYRRVITYILDSESGTSLRAAGWRFVRAAGGGSWSREGRARVDKAPIVLKQLWEACA